MWTFQALQLFRSIHEHFTIQQDNAPAHRANETVEFLSRNIPDYIALWLWTPNSPDMNPVDYIRSVGCAPRTRVSHRDSTRWSFEAATYRRVESLRPENHRPSSASVACSTAWVCSSKTRPLWAQTVGLTNIVLRDFPMLERWVFWCPYTQLDGDAITQFVTNQMVSKLIGTTTILQF